MNKLRIEIEQQKTIEQYLRNQLTYMTKCDQADKLKIEKLEQENESLQSKFNKLNTQKQKEKEEIEKKFNEERKQKQLIEKILLDEKRARESQERQLQQQLLKQQTKQQQQNGETNKSSLHNGSINGNCDLSNCTEMCKRRLRDMEHENKKWENECMKRQERIFMLESELKTLAKYKESELNAEDLRQKLNSISDKNASLQESLSAETRFKLDLFSALGEARRQLEFANCNFVFFFHILGSKFVF